MSPAQPSLVPEKKEPINMAKKNPLSPEARSIINSKLSRRALIAGAGGLGAAGLLTACGGSGDGSSSNPVAPPPTVLSTFGDGAGVARATATENGLSLVAHVMAADIQNFALDYSVAFDTSGVTYQGSNAYGNSYDGYVTANGVQLYLWVFEDNTGEVVMAYALFLLVPLSSLTPLA